MLERNNVGWSTYSDGVPGVTKIYCCSCDDIIEEGEGYINMNNNLYCRKCFDVWVMEHTEYNG